LNRLLSELNTKQREAVLSEEKRLLVLAGAGSGKTKTLIQKILYLISEKNVDPSSILAITFTRNAANEMMDRLILAADTTGRYKTILTSKQISRQERNKERRRHIKKYPWLSNITVKTFHSLCYHILRRYGVKEFDNKFKILMDNTYDEEMAIRRLRAIETPEDIMDKIVVKRCGDPEFLLELKRYILDFYVDALHIKSHKKRKIDYAKPYTTLSGIKVRSKSERDIADWLYRHRIQFEYEPSIEPGRFEFQPDFFINETNIYLEHVSSRSYPLEDKEREMEDAGKIYLKIHEKDTHDTNYFNHVMDDMIISRLDRDLTKVSALDVAEEFKGYGKYRRQFVLDVLRAIDKIKVEDKDIEEVYEKAAQDEHERVRLFYEFLKMLRKDYEDYCINKSYLDFNDLLIRTVSLLQHDARLRNFFHKRLNYILVDEFQDVNTIQVKLLEYFLTSKNQLFCVGDDWQSIYGWRGSNVKYIVEFKETFPDGKTIMLDINYRSNDTIVAASNEVISHNEFQIEKEVKSINKSGKKIYLYSAEKEEQDGVEIVIDNVKNLLKSGYVKEEILVLSRTRKSDAYGEYYYKLRPLGVKTTTMHQAKGLEARVVFVVGLTRGFLGFPDVRDTDRIFQMIKPSNFDLLMEEERRLFYVALTRAREELFLISEVGNESEFIKEIPGRFIDRSNFLILNLNQNVKTNCYNCGKEIQEEFLFCPFCGTTCTSNLVDDRIQLIILDCLDMLSVDTGRTFLSKILGGSRSQRTADISLNENPHYGALGVHTLKEILAMIDFLRSENYIGTHESDSRFKRPLLHLTPEGKEKLRSLKK